MEGVCMVEAGRGEFTGGRAAGGALVGVVEGSFTEGGKGYW